MNSLLDLSGQIRVDLTWDKGVISAVQLHNSRPQQLTHFFTGKPLGEVLNLIPLLYSLCGMAQHVAALRAAESALDLPVDAEVEHARELLVTAETARELGFRLLTDWLPEKSGYSRELMHWFTQLKTALNGVLKLQPAGGVPSMEWLQAQSASLQQLLEQIFDCRLPSQPGSEPFNLILNRLIAQLPAELSALFNASDRLIKPSAPALEDQLHGNVQWLITEMELRGDQFCAMPEQQGNCYETSVWSRCRDAEVLNNSNPLRGRLAALLKELLSMPARMAEAPDKAQVNIAEKGYGMVTAGRGILIHHIDLQGTTVSDSRVNEYRIVAPTEWNFHPQGTLVQMLEGVRVAEAQVRPLVESLIRLVDPCVSWQLNVEINHA